MNKGLLEEGSVANYLLLGVLDIPNLYHEVLGLNPTGGSIPLMTVHCTEPFIIIHDLNMRVVGYGEDVVYLTSSGHPTDIGLQSGKACYLYSRCG